MCVCACVHTSVYELVRIWSHACARQGKGSVSGIVDTIFHVLTLTFETGSLICLGLTGKAKLAAQRVSCSSAEANIYINIHTHMHTSMQHTHEFRVLNLGLHAGRQVHHWLSHFTSPNFLVIWFSSVLGIYSNEPKIIVFIKTCAWILTTAFSVIAPSWKK